MKFDSEWWFDIMKTRSFSFKEVFPGTPEYDAYLTLRYAVFCEELNRVETSDANLKRETDIYDQYSRHFLATHIDTGSLAACARLILPNPSGFNIQARYEIKKESAYPDAALEEIAEISRMAISSAFRRRRTDAKRPVCGSPEDELPNSAHEEEHASDRKHQPEIVLGMYRAIYQSAKESGISHYMAAMDPMFTRLLGMLGFPFKPAGPINMQVRPARRPYMMSNADLEQHLLCRNPSLLEFLAGEAVSIPGLALKKAVAGSTHAPLAHSKSG